jgi:hypothetical protein
LRLAGVEAGGLVQPRLELAHADPTAQLHVFQLSDLGGWTRSIVGNDVGHGKPLPLAPIAGARRYQMSSWLSASTR